MNACKHMFMIFVCTNRWINKCTWSRKQTRNKQKKTRTHKKAECDENSWRGCRRVWEGEEAEGYGGRDVLCFSPWLPDPRCAFGDFPKAAKDSLSLPVRCLLYLYHLSFYIMLLPPDHPVILSLSWYHPCLASHFTPFLLCHVSAHLSCQMRLSLGCGVGVKMQKTRKKRERKRERWKGKRSADSKKKT